MERATPITAGKIVSVISDVGKLGKGWKGKEGCDPTLFWHRKGATNWTRCLLGDHREKRSTIKKNKEEGIGPTLVSGLGSRERRRGGHPQWDLAVSVKRGSHAFHQQTHWAAVGAATLYK